MQNPVGMKQRSSEVLAVVGVCLALSAALPAAVAQGAPPPVNFTAEQDHQNMMDQLGIKALRPGPSGDEKAPNHANYDESLPNPYPNLPDVLTLKNGQEGDDAGDVVEAAPSGDRGRHGARGLWPAAARRCPR